MNKSLGAIIFLFLLGAACRQPPQVRAPSDTKKENQVANKIEKTQEEWKKELTPEQFYVLRQKGTERAFSGKLHDFKGKGVYLCAACKALLFRSDEKFDSGTGWPSFWAPAEASNIGEEQDNSLFMRRTEVHCNVCGGHLGHVFDDGPQPTGKRYCINSVSLEFKEETASEPKESPKQSR